MELKNKKLEKEKNLVKMNQKNFKIMLKRLLPITLVKLKKYLKIKKKI